VSTVKTAPNITLREACETIARWYADGGRTLSGSALIGPNGLTVTRMLAVALDAEVPALQGDDMRTIHPTVQTERRVVWGLLRHMAANGWKPSVVSLGDMDEAAVDAKATMEHVFSVDEARVHFKSDAGASHSILLIAGNGLDIISDWTFSAKGADNFNEVVEAYIDSLNAANPFA
jgi:hypothetical protein